MVQTEPLLKDVGGAGEKAADVHEHRKPQQREGRPCENLFEFAGEELAVEAADELRAAVIVAQLRDDQVQHEIEQIAEAEDQQDLAQAVARRERGHGQNAGADAVADDDAAGLEKAEGGFALDLGHMTEPLCDDYTISMRMTLVLPLSPLVSPPVMTTVSPSLSCRASFAARRE